MEIYCTVKCGFTEINGLTNQDIVRFKLNPCSGCAVRSLAQMKESVEKLADEYISDYEPTNNVNITIIRHEDNPSVPKSVKVGDQIVASCSPDFE